MTSKKLSISIVTPSFNMLPYLKLCHASVADQGVEVEHVVSDGGSSDGTQDWLKQTPDIVFKSEKDSGMYNALNKAINMSTGEIVGHLNCDEQYLPGVLPFVQNFFQDNPDVDFIAANFLVVDPDGEFVAYRKSFQPRWPYFFSNYLYTTTCTLFYRRKIFDKCSFDESYRSIADVIFLYSVLKAGFKGAHISRYFATFTYSGTNLSLNPISAIEKKRFNVTLPGSFKILKPLYFFLFFIEKVIHGNYFEKAPLAYSIYKKDNITRRLDRLVNNPGFRLKFKATDQGKR